MAQRELSHSTHRSPLTGETVERKNTCGFCGSAGGFFLATSRTAASNRCRSAGSGISGLLRASNKYCRAWSRASVTTT